MPNEELIQRGYIVNGRLKGDTFGIFERLNLGSTTVAELQRNGLVPTIPSSIGFPFTSYTPPKRPASAKPDEVYFQRNRLESRVVAITEMKRPLEFDTDDKRRKAAEQGLYSGAALSAKVAVVSDGTSYMYIDIEKSLQEQQLVTINEGRDFNPGILEGLLSGELASPRNPKPLVEKVWQAIWHATKEEPRACLMTFVEIFILKFLSDNLPSHVLPGGYSFYELTNYDSAAFENRYGKTQIEYYVYDIRPRIKQIFPDRSIIRDPEILRLLGLNNLVSQTSVINGFAFLQSGDTSLPTFNRTFVEILRYFQDFGPLTNIDPEFKLRLYETFLKESSRQSKLGQFFTPRNVVRAMIKMARLAELPDGAIVVDPAAGVGGFILEPLIEPNALAGNVTFVNGQAKQRVRLLGIDVDTNTNILAKANTLIHLAEYVRDPKVTVQGLNQLMAEMFLLLNLNQHLGTLEYPIRNQVDVIITNPPYVTQGSRIYKDEINTVKGSRNGLDLRDYYGRSGLGLESLFLRYISGALKPGGFAYVIVPQGLLTRTEQTTKDKLLSECNLRASIALPRGTFFSTEQKTFILVFEKRHTAHDDRPDVLGAIVSSVGESLDARRIPMPTDNTLDDVANAFVAYVKGLPIPLEATKRVRIVPASEFKATDRWDVQRFYSDQDLVDLGAREAAIPRLSFIDETSTQLEQLLDDLQAVKQEISTLESGPMVTLSIADSQHFHIRRGKRVTRKDGDEHPGDIPVYSGSKDPKRPITSVAEAWAASQGIPIERSPIITVNANGYVGATFVRREPCIIHDDVMIIEVLTPDIDLDYASQVLRGAIAAGNYEYEAKLYSRVKELEIDVPVDAHGGFDLTRQQQIADALKRFDTIRMNIVDLAAWVQDARIMDSEDNNDDSSELASVNDDTRDNIGTPDIIQPGLFGSP